MPKSFSEAVIHAFPPEERHLSTINELSVVLANFIDAASMTDRVDAFVGLFEWVRRKGGRIELVVVLLETSDPIRTEFQKALGLLLLDTDGVRLFGEAGLPSDRGFLAEFGERLLDRILPAPRDDKDLAKLLRRLYRTHKHVRQFRELPLSLFDRLVRMLSPEGSSALWDPIVNSFSDGFRLLSSRVQSEGLSQNLRTRSHQPSIADSPFYKMTRLSQAVIETWEVQEGTQTTIPHWKAECERCRAEMKEIAQRLETDGVSVDIVYGLEVIELCLTRMQAMIEIIDVPPGTHRSAAIKAFLTSLIVASQEERSLRQLIHSTLRLLHKKIVDRSGKAGEHYIARDRAEYWYVWKAAAGGGLLTTLTAALKMRIVATDLPLFIEGLLSGVNYSISFVLLQVFGFVLATKQPAMTAATLATILRDHRGTERLDEIIDFTACITRSQLAAAISNVTLVTVGAFSFDYLWQLLNGSPFLNPEEAKHVFKTLSPISSGTIFYAIVTGVILWLSSLMGGWIDNWAVYRRLPLALEEHALGRRFGVATMKTVAQVFSNNVAGVATSISLGMMLGMAPAIGHFMGIPLDVRHVTLSTGTLALACGTFRQNWFDWTWLLWAIAGIATMFVLNLGVSFLLSLYTAARAYDLLPKELAQLLARLWRRFLKSPRDFLLPPREASQLPS